MNIQKIISLVAIIFCSAVVSAQSPPPPPSPSANTPAPETNKSARTGTISGRVLSDDGQPLAGAAVNLFKIGGEERSQNVLTDEEGHFKFTDVIAGSYNVSSYGPSLISAPSLEPVRYRIGDTATITLVKGGVITGKVTNAGGEPLVGYFVGANRVRDEEGKAVSELYSARQMMTDDRGVYRLYGLRPGFYVVFTERKNPYMGMGRDNEVETFYPAATRDTAQEVSVSAGADTVGIDIRHREEMGHAISGMVVGLADAASQSGVNVSIKSIATGASTNSTSVNVRGGDNSFALYGVADGEYEIEANYYSYANQRSEFVARSNPQKIIVRGADVTGLNLKLLKLSKINGRVTIEKVARDQNTCRITRAGLLEEIVIGHRSGITEKIERQIFARDTAPDDKGEFSFPSVAIGNYRLTWQLPSDDWFAKNISLPAPAAKPGVKTVPLDVARQGFNVSASSDLTGLQFGLSEGAAQITGKLATASDKAASPRLRVHLLPAEANAVENILRYYEVITRDGKFMLRNLAPGKYWIMVQPLAATESDERPKNPAAWDANERANLRKLAEAANTQIELSSCQRVQDFVLKP